MNKKKILLVEDEINIALMLRKLLEAEGYDVIVETNGITALERAFSWLPDLILLDLVLPRMNGFLVCEALKHDDKTRNIPVIILSARAEEKDIIKAKELGAEDYLVKPVATEKLLARIKSFI